MAEWQLAARAARRGVGGRVRAAILVALALLAPRVAEARIVRIEIVSRESPAFGGRRFGAVGQYEKLVGFAYGEVDPNDRRNALIQDIALAPRNARGMVEYVATFTILRPLDPARGNGVLLHDMVNRGNKLLLLAYDRACADVATGTACDLEGAGDGLLLREGYTILWSGWQGDLAPVTSRTDRHVLETVRVPVARNADGSPITGPVLARWSDLPAGTSTLRLAAAGIPAVALGAYLPASRDARDARLETHARESATGVIEGVRAIARDDWTWGDCTRTPFPGAPDSTSICLRHAADPALLYQLVYTARDPLVLMLGFAALRDVGSFFRYEARDASGTPNPLAGTIRHVIATGLSQSGNTQKTFIHYGFNEDERGRMVWDGANPHIAARQNPVNFRFARPGGAATLYEPGSEAVVWWERYEDTLRHRPPAGMLDRCRATRTCPKIFETMGSTEFWGLRESPDFVGTSGRDIPLPANVRRYYFPSTTHGGGNGAFTREPPHTRAVCVLPDNPAPQAEHQRALLGALAAWVTRGVAPPPSRYPRAAKGGLVSPERVAARFPRIPGAPSPDGMLVPLLDYDFGPGFEPNDMRGMLSVVPPVVRGVLPSLVPRIDDDGNEPDGVRSPLLENPLGTYTGWNVTATGFSRGQSCGFTGGFIPFAETRAERVASGDPRPSLEERYGTHAEYVRRVRASARLLVRERFLLAEDAARIVAAAEASGVLRGAPTRTGMVPRAVPCDSAALAALPLQGARVTHVERVDSGRVHLADSPAVDADLPAFCRVHGVASSEPGSRIEFELWMPAGAWNGKLVATGNGGYSPRLSHGDMAMALRRGYAALGGDTGHQTTDPNDLSFVVGHPERMADWGSRSIHTILGPGKVIAAALGGHAVRRAYFYGCSTGGHQGFAELQRYPGDFDGVIAGAPGNDRVRLNAGFLWQFLANHAPHDSVPILTPAKVAMVTRAVVAACDAIDGVHDGVIDDPRDCAWSPASLRCAGGDAPDCLTAAQVAALERMYRGARNPRTGEQVYPGWPKGSEAGWPYYWGTTEPARAGFWRTWVFENPRWDWWTFDFDRDLALADERVGRVVDQRNADLAAFRQHGGKAIVYQGWADPVVSAYGTIAYYDRVRAAAGSQSATDEFFRLFLVPGMGHCARGAGATSFGNAGGDAPVCDAEHDLLEALDRWVEHGVAPDRIVASRVEQGRVTRTRPLCPYPRRARYVGTGDTDAASSFACR